MKKICVLLIIIVLLGYLPKASSVHINLDDVYFIVDNERYNCSDMDFSSIIIGSDYIVFNTTGFYVDAPNNINITLYFINSSMDGIQGDRLLNFSSKTSSGLVYFNISGFNMDSNYTVNRTGDWYINDTANATGFINWTNDDWSNQQWWDVYVKTPITTLTTFIPVFLYKTLVSNTKIMYYPLFLLFIIPIFLFFIRSKRGKYEKLYPPLE